MSEYNETAENLFMFFFIVIPSATMLLFFTGLLICTAWGMIQDIINLFKNRQ